MSNDSKTGHDWEKGEFEMSDKKIEMRNTGLAYLLWCTSLFGVCGVHRFYTGNYVSGLVWLFTLGFFGFGQFVDLFLIPGMVERKNLKYQLSQSKTYQNNVNPEIILKFSDAKKYTQQEMQPIPEQKSDTYTILKLAKDNPKGISVADCVIATEKPIAEVKTLLNNLYKEGLLHLDNDLETGAIIYRIV